jgi:hypothetical protein
MWKAAMAPPIKTVATRRSDKQVQPAPIVGEGRLNRQSLGLLKGKIVGPETTDEFCAICIFSSQ